MQILEVPHRRPGEAIELRGSFLVAAELRLEHTNAAKRFAQPSLGANQLITGLEELFLESARVTPEGSVMLKSLTVASGGLVVQRSVTRRLIRAPGSGADWRFRRGHGRDATGYLPE